MTLFAETFQPPANQPNLPPFQNLLICSSLFSFYQDPTQMTSLPAQLVHSFKGFVLTSSPPPPTQAARFLSVTKTDKIIYPGPDKNFRLAIRYNWYCFLPNKFFDLVPAKKNCLGPDRIFVWQLSIIATLGSILDSQLSWESGKLQLARWSNRVVLFLVRTNPTRPTRRVSFKGPISQLLCQR